MKSIARVLVAAIALSGLTVNLRAETNESLGSGDSASARIQEGQNAAAHDLRDPDSAKFRNGKLNGAYVCGEINATNGFGGYVGFRSFYATPTPNSGWSAAIRQDDLSQDDADWCFANINPKHRDRAWFSGYQIHRCTTMDGTFRLLYHIVCEVSRVPSPN